jgi:hypothetical protein
MKTNLLMFVLMFLALTTGIFAQDNPSVASAAPAQTDMQKWIATTDAQWQAMFKRDVTDVHEAELNRLKLQYLTSLEDAIKKASSAGDLDGAVALRNEQKRFGDTNVFPEQDDAADSVSVKQLRAAIRIQLAKLEKDNATRIKALLGKYDQVLAQAQTQLTQHQRLDDALLIKAKRAEVATVWLTPANAKIDELSPSSQMSPVGHPKNPKETLATDKTQIQSLPKEDQEIVRGLKFSHPEPAPLGSRHFRYIKGHIQVTNSGPKDFITGKLQIEMLILCRDKDNNWKVIRCVTGFDIPKAGEQTVEVSFKDQNSLITKLSGGEKAPLPDSYTIVRYMGAVIGEFRAEPTSASPTEWWKNGELIYHK